MMNACPIRGTASASKEAPVDAPEIGERRRWRKSPWDRRRVHYGNTKNRG